jgi:predicted dithiol-disulfide oxidoreductase (DUF899 family)
MRTTQERTMEEKLARVHERISTARHELPQATTDDPHLFEAVESLEAAMEWLLSAVEQLADQQASR